MDRKVFQSSLGQNRIPSIRFNNQIPKQQNSLVALRGGRQLRTRPEIQLPQVPMLQKKPVTKLDTNKHFSCLFIQGQTLYLGTRNSKLYVYSLKPPHQGQLNQFLEEYDLVEQKIITPHCEVVSLVTANQEYFVTVPESDQDSLISIWQTHNKMLLTALKGHKSQVSQIIILAGGKYLASASWDCTVRIWSLENLEKDEQIKIFTGNYPILELRQFNDDILVFGGDDCYLVFWDWKHEQIIKREFGHAGSVTFIQVMSNRVFTAGGDNKFKVWEVQHNQEDDEMFKEEGMLDFKAKYHVRKIQQHKQNYDSIIYGGLIQIKKGSLQLLLMDRQGQLFIYSQNQTIYRLKNQFDYNQNITGINVFGHHLLVTTTKGCLKNFDLRVQVQAVEEQDPSEQVEELQDTKKVIVGQGLTEINDANSESNPNGLQQQSEVKKNLSEAQEKNVQIFGKSGEQNPDQPENRHQIQEKKDGNS